MDINSKLMIAQLPPSNTVAVCSYMLLAALVASQVSPAQGHARLLEPPSRQSMWRSGYDAPRNYDDHALYCGGRSNQWDVQGGRCGLCGDPWQGPRDYERPDGRMVQHDIIPRTYRQGQGLDVRVQMTVNHLGWFEFRICDISTVGGVEATQECLDHNVLANATGHTQFEVPAGRLGYYDYSLVLPSGLTCTHCMIQWKWHCGNSPGYGIQQEEFYGCSDVSITPREGQLPVPVTTQAPITTRSSTTLAPTTTTATTATTTTTTTTTTTQIPTTSSTSTTTPSPPSTTTRQPLTASPTPIDDPDAISQYFHNQATKQPVAPDSPSRPRPQPKYTGGAGQGEDVLCTTCRGTSCRFPITCSTACPHVCPLGQ